MTTFTESTTPVLLSSSTLVGDSIVNRQGDDLGKLKEIMIDTNTGEVAYAVLSRGGFAGLGEKLFAVPWGLLTVDRETKNLTLDATEQLFDDSLGFDADNWPSFDDVDWHEDLHRRFGIAPYWQRTTSGANRPQQTDRRNPGSSAAVGRYPEAPGPIRDDTTGRDGLTTGDVTMNEGTGTKWEGRWDQLKGKAKQMWGNVTDDDLDVAEGKYDEMIGRIKERTGETEESIRERLDRD